MALGIHVWNSSSSCTMHIHPTLKPKNERNFQLITSLLGARDILFGK